jgi:branched-chain amino acid transport system permease protein
MLSDLTEIWQLYFGLLFIAMVMFAPSGLAGLIMMHRPLWRAGTLLKVLPAYLVALVPLLSALLGAALLVEIAHHIAVKSTSGPAMSFMRIRIQANEIGPWIVGILLAGGGLLAFLRARRIVVSAWNRATTAVPGGRP